MALQGICRSSIVEMGMRIGRVPSCKPSDIGFDDGGVHSADRAERRRTIEERCERAAELVRDTGKPAIVWCHLNDEGDLLERSICGSVQVSGKDIDEKEAKFLSFLDGQSRVLITKKDASARGGSTSSIAHIA